MICADTSVWVAALRDAASPGAWHLAELAAADEVVMPAPVRVEILTGAPRREFVSLRDRLAALPQASPDHGTWERIEQWVQTAVTAGQRFGVSDLLIAACAAEAGAKVWSDDADFARMEKLGFIELYAAPSA